MVHDDKAEELEAKGLWRRAANRWGELLKQAASDEARQYVTERRTACIRKATITTSVTVDAFTPLGERYYDNHNTYRTGKAHQPD